MCLGAVLWSGVSRVVFAATREDAARLSFDEGPVFPESYDYLGARGVAVTREVCRAEAAQVFDRYLAQGGDIYNG
jgi:tRNA(Arg) A34 adenosine deaminase TadA